jgi:hypothetical protein
MCYRFSVKKLDQFKGSTSLVARARRLLDYHQQCRADSGRGMTTSTCRQLALAVTVVARWSNDLDEILLYLAYFIVSISFYNRPELQFLKEK